MPYVISYEMQAYWTDMRTKRIKTLVDWERALRDGLRIMEVARGFQGREKSTLLEWQSTLSPALIPIRLTSKPGKHHELTRRDSWEWDFVAIYQ
jgi:hypothetical protein